MGLYDSLMAPCPNCGNVNEFQSKSGDCVLIEYKLHNCPDDVMEDVNRHSPIKCDCGTLLEIDIITRQVKYSINKNMRRKAKYYVPQDEEMIKARDKVRKYLNMKNVMGMNPVYNKLMGQKVNGEYNGKLSDMDLDVIDKGLCKVVEAVKEFQNRLKDGKDI